MIKKPITPKKITEVTQEDMDSAVEFWKRNSPDGYQTILDATTLPIKESVDPEKKYPIVKPPKNPEN